MQFVDSEKSEIPTSRSSLGSNNSRQTELCTRKTSITSNQVVHVNISMVQDKKLVSGDELGFACLSVEQTIFVDYLLAAPSMVWHTRCLNPETDRPYESWLFFQPNSPGSPWDLDCTVRKLLVSTGIPNRSAPFNSKEARAWTSASMWICKCCHLALLYYNKMRYSLNARVLCRSNTPTRDVVVQAGCVSSICEALYSKEMGSPATAREVIFWATSLSKYPNLWWAIHHTVLLCRCAFGAISLPINLCWPIRELDYDPGTTAHHQGALWAI